jgi:undecaprenyl diphosphate synthase
MNNYTNRDSDIAKAKLHAALSMEKLPALNESIKFITDVCYGRRTEISTKTMEAKEHPEMVDDILNMDISGFDKYLSTYGIPDPDLIVRTSGECRLSNYLLWQGAYSELLFVDTLWPDFRKEEFGKAVEYYTKRDRRYGKVK